MSKFFRTEEAGNKGDRILSDQLNCMTLQDFLQDFADVSLNPFTDGTRSLDWGISSLLIILRKSTGKLLRLSRLTINSFTIVTISFQAATYF